MQTICNSCRRTYDSYYTTCPNCGVVLESIAEPQYPPPIPPPICLKCGKPVMEPTFTAHFVEHCPRNPTGWYKCQWPMGIGIVCGKSFQYKSSLKQHILAHTGEKPYMCPIAGCGASFNRQDILKQHIRDLHPLKGPDPTETASKQGQAMLDAWRQRQSTLPPAQHPAALPGQPPPIKQLQPDMVCYGVDQISFRCGMVLPPGFYSLTKEQTYLCPRCKENHFGPAFILADQAMYLDSEWQCQCSNCGQRFQVNPGHYSKPLIYTCPCGVTNSI